MKALKRRREISPTALIAVQADFQEEYKAIDGDYEIFWLPS
jgi:hypothetical protein